MAAGAVSQRAGEICLAHAGGSGENHILLISQITAVAEPQEVLFCDSLLPNVFHILGHAGQPELRLPDVALDSPRMLCRPFGVHQHAEPFLKVQALNFRLLHLPEQLFRHGVELHLPQPRGCRVVKHASHLRSSYFRGDLYAEWAWPTSDGFGGFAAAF